MTAPPCDYCYRRAPFEITLRNGAFRSLLGLPVRTRRVCSDHLDRARRPGGWRA